MYKILIVDDDASARNGLSRCIDWKKMDLEIAGFAFNGRDAIEFVERHPVDIVLSDVCMPGMDGLELCRILHGSYPEIQILLISGYGEVDYLKTAIEVRAVNYILKPVKVTELEKSIAQAVERIRDHQLQNEMAEKLRSSMPILRERFLVRLLEGTISRKDAAIEQASFLGIDLQAENYCVLLVSVTRQTSSPMESQLHQLELQEELRGMYSCLRRRGYVVPINDQSSALIDLDEENRLMFAEEVLDALRRKFDCDVDIGFGSEVTDIERLRFSLSVACQAVNQAYFEGHNHVFSAQPRLYEMNENRCFWDGGSYLTGVLYRSENDLRAYISSVFAGLKQGAPAKEIQAVSQEMLLTAIKLLFDCGKQSDMPVKAAALMADIPGFDTLGELQDAVWGFMKELYELLNNENRTLRQKLIAQIREYIDLHYMENITVRQIAESMHYSAAYLTTLFRTETGITINAALTERRMNVAAELLRTTDLHVYEIAERVGYSDVKYFTQLFRKACNMQPTAYRA